MLCGCRARVEREGDRESGTSSPFAFVDSDRAVASCKSDSGHPYHVRHDRDILCALAGRAFGALISWRSCDVSRPGRRAFDEERRERDLKQLR